MDPSASLSESTNTIVEESPPSTSEDIPFTLLPYGEGHFRLLRFLDNGYPVWEAPPIQPKQEDRETKASENQLQSKASVLQDVQQFAEAFSLAVDTLQRLSPFLGAQTSLLAKPFYHSERWIEAISYRDSAARWLASLLALIDLLLGTLSHPSNAVFLTLAETRHEGEMLRPMALPYASHTLNHQPSLHPIPLSFKYLRIAMANRATFLPQLKLPCLRAYKQIQSSLSFQMDFLTILRQLRVHWKLLRRRYTPTDVTDTSGNYPYLAEIIVEFFSLPAKGWDLGETPVFLSWPPYPNVPPFRTQYAHVQFKAHKAFIRKDTEHKDAPNAESFDDAFVEGEQCPSLQYATIRFEGAPSHFIEKKFRLKLSIHLLDTAILPRHKDDSLIESLENAIEMMLPDTIVHPLAQQLHLQLKSAQWTLLDKALFSVLSCQAHKFQAASYAGGKRNSILLLQRLYQQNRKNYQHQGNSFPIMENLECLRSDSSEMTLYIKGLQWANYPQDSLTEGVDATSAIRKDIFIRFSHTPSHSIRDHEPSAPKPEGSFSVCQDKRHCVYNEVLSALERYALSKLRSLFIDAWKFRSIDMPQLGLDINVNVLNNMDSFYNPGKDILCTFLLWLLPHISDMPLTPMSHESLSVLDNA